MTLKQLIDLKKLINTDLPWNSTRFIEDTRSRAVEGKDSLVIQLSPEEVDFLTGLYKFDSKTKEKIQRISNGN